MITKLKLLIGNFIYVFERLTMRGFINTFKALHLSVKLIIHPKDDLYDKWHNLNLNFLQYNLNLNLRDFSKPQNITNYRIWTLWWQGETQMPPIIKATIESIKNPRIKKWS